MKRLFLSLGLALALSGFEQAKKGVYEKSSLKSMEKWEYTPRTAEENDGDRQGMVTTIRYILTDYSGNIIY